MRCPNCGAEVPAGKFCGSCGQSLAPQPAVVYQPGPPPNMPPQRKKGGLLWLWILLGVLAVAIVAVGALAMLGGKDDGGGGTAQTGDKATGATAVMQQYLEARKTGALDTAYGLLSPEARAAYTLDEFKSYLKDTKIIAYGAATSSTTDQKWYSVTVKSVQTSGGTYPTAKYTVLKEDGKFYVAIEVPLVTKFEQAYDAGQYDTALKVADQMIALNPFSYEGFYDKAWVYNETDKGQDAVTSFKQAIALALPTDLPEATRSLGVAHMRLKNWADAAAQLEQAVKLGKGQPDMYDAKWVLQVERDLVTSYQNQGDTVKSHDLLEQLYKANPSDEAVGNLTIKYERTPYKVENGMATYHIFRQGVSFALPQDWVVSDQTTGGDFWFARAPKTPQNSSDFEVMFFDADKDRSNLDQATDWLLDYLRHPIGSPARDVSITAKQNVTVSGQPAYRLDVSTGQTFVVAKAKQQWVYFEFFNRPEAKAAYAGWLPTVKLAQ